MPSKLTCFGASKNEKKMLVFFFKYKKLKQQKGHHTTCTYLLAKILTLYNNYKIFYFSIKLSIFHYNKYKKFI